MARAVEINDGWTIDYLRQESATCIPGEQIEVTTSTLEDTYVVACEDAKEFIERLDYQKEGLVEGNRLAILFRTHPVDTDSVVKGIVPILFDYALGGTLMPSELADKAKGVMKSFSPSEAVDLALFLKTGIYRALDYSGAGYSTEVNSITALPHVTHLMATLAAAASGLELVDEYEIDRFLVSVPPLAGGLDDGRFAALLRQIAQRLDGNSSELSPVEEAAFNIIHSALKLDTIEVINATSGELYSGLFAREIGRSTDIMQDAARVLFGVYYYLSAREPKHQLIYCNLDEVQFDLSELLPKGSVVDGEFVGNTNSSLKESIKRQVIAAYKDFPNIEIVFERPSNGEYSTIYFATTIRHVQDCFTDKGEFFKTPVGKRVCQLLFSKDMPVVLGMMPPNIRDYYIRSYGSSPCDGDVMAFMLGPVAAYAFSVGSRGNAFYTDWGNINHSDSAVVTVFVKYLRQSFPLPEDFVREYRVSHPNVGNTLNFNITPTSKSRSYYELSGPDDIAQIEAIGTLVGEVAAHELGHLLGLGHVPDHWQQHLGPSLMSGMERPPPSVDGRDPRWDTLSEQDKAILALSFSQY